MRAMVMVAVALELVRNQLSSTARLGASLADNVGFLEIPEPVALTLLGLAMLLVARQVRRRRRLEKSGAWQ
jgi:hypothetical protein